MHLDNYPKTIDTMFFRTQGTSKPEEMSKTPGQNFFAKPNLGIENLCKISVTQIDTTTVSL